jgi:hypothetical protein
MVNQEGSGGGTNSSDDGGHVTKSLMHTTYASCAQQQQQQSDNEAAAVEGLTSLASSVQGHPHWSHHAFSVIGFNLSLLNATLPENQPLSLSLWPSTITKGSFMKYG